MGRRKSKVRLPKLNYESDVLTCFNGRSQLPAEFVTASVFQSKDWWWYCDRCLVRQSWAEFDRSNTGWPMSPCHSCQDRLFALQDHLGVPRNPHNSLQGKRSHAQRIARRSVDAIGSRAMLGSKDEYRSLETLATVAIDACGGVTGFADMVRRLVADPTNMNSRKHKLAISLLASLEAMENVRLKREQLERQKPHTVEDLSKYSEEELRDVLRPMFIDLLKKSPTLGIKALRQNGYLVAKGAKQIVDQIRRLEKRQQADVLSQLLGSRLPHSRMKSGAAATPEQADP